MKLRQAIKFFGKIVPGIAAVHCRTASVCTQSDTSSFGSSCNCTSIWTLAVQVPRSTWISFRSDREWSSSPSPLRLAASSSSRASHPSRLSCSGTQSLSFSVSRIAKLSLSESLASSMRLADGNSQRGACRVCGAARAASGRQVHPERAHHPVRARLTDLEPEDFHTAAARRQDTPTTALLQLQFQASLLLQVQRDIYKPC